MFHGKISKEIAKGLRGLRDRIDEAEIPPSILDETLNLATWNVKYVSRSHTSSVDLLLLDATARRRLERLCRQ